MKFSSGATTPTMTATTGGAVPTPPNNTTTFLRGDGTFAAPNSGGLSSKVITFTRDQTLAGGDVAYIGVGFVPTSVIIFGAGGSINIGMAAFDSAKGGGGVFAGDSFTAAAAFRVGTSTAYQQAIVKTYDSDGFTLTWTKTGLPGGTSTMYAICFK